MMSGIYKTEAGKEAIEAFYAKALDRWPVPSTRAVVPTRHGNTFVVASGPESAAAVILLHGSGSNSAIWMRDVAEWSRHRRVFAVDIIGEPGLSAPSRPPLRSSAYVEWLDDVCNALGVTSANLVAISLGASLALEYAVKRPSRVTSLSLLSPAGIGRRKQLFMIKAGVMLLLGRTGIRKAFSSASGNASVPPALAQYITLIFENFRPRREAPPIRSDAELRALSMPVQVIVGGRDAMIHTRDTADRIRRHMPRAELIVIEDAGHMLPPQTARVGEFLSTVEQRLGEST
jgi:pimeloyl-ACP methyl ester carboxylesterase